MKKYDLILQREERKKALKNNILRVIKRHQEWETIGVPKGTQIRIKEIKEVLKYLLNNVWS